MTEQQQHERNKANKKSIFLKWMDEAIPEQLLMAYPKTKPKQTTELKHTQ